MESYLLTQTIGRVLRKDYTNQEGLVNIILVKDGVKTDNEQISDILTKLKQSLSISDSDISRIVEICDIDKPKNEKIIEIENKIEQLKNMLELERQKENELQLQRQNRTIEKNHHKLNECIALSIINGKALTYESFLEIIELNKIKNHKDYTDFLDKNSSFNLPTDYISHYPNFSWNSVNNNYHETSEQALASIRKIKNENAIEFDLLDPEDQEQKQNFCHSKDSKIPPYNIGSLGSFYQCDILDDI